MFLAQCPHCHTIFQTDFSVLGPHGGRVTCGECRQIFNAFDHPYSLDLPEIKDGRTLTTFADDLAAYKPVSVVKESTIDIAQAADLQLNDGLATFLKDRSSVDNIPAWEEETAARTPPTESLADDANASVSPSRATGSSNLSFLLIDPNTENEPVLGNETEPASDTTLAASEPTMTEATPLIEETHPLTAPEETIASYEPVTDVISNGTVTTNEASTPVPAEPLLPQEPASTRFEALAVNPDHTPVTSEAPAIHSETAITAAEKPSIANENPLHQAPIRTDEPMPNAMAYKLTAYQTEDDSDDTEDSVADSIVAISQPSLNDIPSAETVVAESPTVTEAVIARTTEGSDTELDDFVSLLKDTQPAIGTMATDIASQSTDPLTIAYPDNISTEIVEKMMDIDMTGEAESAEQISSATPAMTEVTPPLTSGQNNLTDPADAVEVVILSAMEPPLHTAERPLEPSAPAIAIDETHQAEETDTVPVKKRRIWSTLLVSVLILLLLGQAAYFFRNYLPVDITLLWPMIRDMLPADLPFSI